MATSVGMPRFPLGYELAGSVGMLAPYGLLKIDDLDVFTPLYRERLDRYGTRKIERVLRSLAAGADAAGVVLLCFEDIAESWCHRRVFAAWWQEQTGQNVPELGEGS